MPASKCVSCGGKIPANKTVAKLSLCWVCYKDPRKRRERQGEIASEPYLQDMTVPPRPAPPSAKAAGDGVCALCEKRPVSSGSSPKVIQARELGLCLACWRVPKIRRDRAQALGRPLGKPRGISASPRGKARKKRRQKRTPRPAAKAPRRRRPAAARTRRPRKAAPGRTPGLGCLDETEIAQAASLALRMRRELLTAALAQGQREVEALDEKIDKLRAIAPAAALTAKPVKLIPAPA